MITFPANITVETNVQLFTVAMAHGFVYDSNLTEEENVALAIPVAQEAGRQTLVAFVSAPFNREIDLQAIAYTKTQKEEVKQLAEAAVVVGEPVIESND